MALGSKHWLAVVVAGAALALPAPALADGTWQFQSDQSHVDAKAKTSDGKSSYEFVLTLPQEVASASAPSGRCVVNFNGDPKAVECTGGTPVPALEIMVVLKSPMACTDTIPLQTSLDNQTYRDDGTLTFSGDCPPPPPSNPPPANPPPSTPDPNEQPAGGSVQKPHNGVVAGEDAGGAPLVRIFDTPTLASFFQFNGYDPAFTGGVRVAAGDVNGDGVLDVITGAGATGGPHAKVFDGATGNLVQSFFAYDPAFTGGIFVAAGDVNGDGHADVITGAGPGGGPQVKVFSGADGSTLRSFYAYAVSFTGGVRVAAGDVNGDGVPDIVTGAGSGGGPQVKVFDGKTGTAVKSFYAFTPGFSGGIYVAAGDLNGDGFADIVVGAGQGGGPHVKVFDGKTGMELESFYAFTPTFTGGVRVAAGDVNGDGVPDVITGPGPTGGPQVKAFDGTSATLIKSFLGFDPGFTGGVFVGIGSRPPPATIGSAEIPLVGHGFALESSCPAGARGGVCNSRLTLLLPAVQKIRTGKSAARKAKKPLVLATKKFKVAAGTRAKVHVALSPRALKALGPKKKLKVLARLVTTDSGGNASARQRTVTLTRR